MAIRINIFILVLLIVQIGVIAIYAYFANHAGYGNQEKLDETRQGRQDREDGERRAATPTPCTPKLLPFLPSQSPRSQLLSSCWAEEYPLLPPYSVFCPRILTWRILSHSCPFSLFPGDISEPLARFSISQPISHCGSRTSGGITYRSWL